MRLHAISVVLVSAALLLSAPSGAHAQEDPSGQPAPSGDLPPGHPPTGSPPPADDPPSGEVSAGHPPTGAMPSGHPNVSGDDQAEMRQRVSRALRPPQPASARPSREVAVGSIRVRVVDGAGQPVGNAEVAIGVMQQSGDRERMTQTTGPDGFTEFTELPTGTAQAYRVNVPHEGATFSSTPFQLPTDRGYDVQVTRLPVTRDASALFLHLFRVIVEQGNERMHIIHHAQLTNAGSATYVFPEEGLRVALPEGALAFQTQALMTDQRVEEVPDEDAYRILGSLPPGTVQLAFAYDLELDGEELDVPVEIPLPVFGIQAIAEAIPGLELHVDGLPDAVRLDADGEECIDSVETPGCAWITQTRRSPEQSTRRSMTLELSGIPGPPDIRYWALAFTFVFLGLGIMLFLRGGGTGIGATRARERRKQQLIREAELLDEDLESGEIGPRFRQKRRAAIVRELAALLLESEAADNKPAR